MLTNANERIETPAQDGLIYDLNPPAEVFAVKIASGDSEKELKRGTVLALDTASGEMSVLGEAGEGSKANCILAVDVKVGTEASETALAYRTGHFAENMLIVADGYTITAADKEALRDVGILLSDAMEY